MRMTSESWNTILQQSRCYRKDIGQIAEMLNCSDQAIRNYLQVFEKIDAGEWETLRNWVLNGRITGHAIIWYCGVADVTCDPMIPEAMVSNKKRSPKKKTADNTEPVPETHEVTTAPDTVPDMTSIESKLDKLSEMLERSEAKTEQYHNDMLEMSLNFSDSVNQMNEMISKINTCLDVMTYKAEKDEKFHDMICEDLSKFVSMVTNLSDQNLKAMKAVEQATISGFDKQTKGILSEIGKTTTQIQTSINNLKKKNTIPML